MKKFLLFLIILGSLSLYANQKPIVRIYFSRVNTKQFYLDSISNFYFTHSNLSYSISVFQKGDLKNDIDIRDIDSIVFESAQVMKVNLPGDTKTFNIFEIDSIIFTFNTCTEIQIGNQIWMCKNLDVDHYRNGDSIPHVKDPTKWAELTKGAWCYYNNDSTLGTTYGKLYNWYAVNDPRGLVPEGWHLLSELDWTTFIYFYGGDEEVGGKLKEEGTSHWQSPNKGATNESGFTALPGGLRDDSGRFSNLGVYGYWWSPTKYDENFSWYRILNCYGSNIQRLYTDRKVGFSVRCVKDK